MVTGDNESSSLGGFHLGAQDERPRAPSVSSLSYKQKIDALFDDTRSINSIQYADVARRDSKVGYCGYSFNMNTRSTDYDSVISLIINRLA